MATNSILGAQGVKIWQAALALVVGLIVFALVLTGTVQATGSAPGGVLAGHGAFFVSLVNHALGGALATWLIFFGWSGCLAFVFALIGAFRRKRPWFIPLLWLVIVVGTQFGISAVSAVLDWFGSASPGVWDGAHNWSPPFWDAAAFWGANALVGTLLLVTIPIYVRGLWQWSNGGSFGDGVIWLLVPVYSITIAFALVPIILGVIIWTAIENALSFLFSHLMDMFKG